jgi:hypothetical protein
MAESVLGPSRSGSVVLNLGTGVGALVLYTPPELDGYEIEISPSGAPGTHRTHSQVRQRRTGGAVQYAAVYPGVAEGDYDVWQDQSTPITAVTITGGEVTSYQWPAGVRPGQ